jgi:phosphoribosylaminoimidazole carboxylase
LDNSTNAALLALRILGLKDERVLELMEWFMKDMESEVVEKAERLEGVGWEEYDGANE